MQDGQDQGHKETKEKIIYTKDRSRWTRWSRKPSKWTRRYVWCYYMNLKWKKRESAPWGPHRKVWDRLLSPSLAIGCQGLRKNDSSIQIEKEINLHGWKNQAGHRFLHRNMQCQKTVAQRGQVWCKNAISSQAVIQVKRQQTDIFKHEKNQDKRKEASMAKLNI